jgi:hypothetical protein
MRSSSLLGVGALLATACAVHAEPVASYLEQRASVIAEEAAGSLYNGSLPWTEREVRAEAVFSYVRFCCFFVCS